VVTGTVRSVDGTPIGAATIDVWQSNADGLYDLQVAGLTEPRWRGVLSAATDGAYCFETVVPRPYEVKKDGPVGALLERLGRHHFRPAHIHCKVRADGYQLLTTMMFIDGDPWLGNDTIGADKPALIVKLDRSRTPATAQFDIVLSPLTVDR
jgi:protocatechuate 3,4-dioxygenase beta subunit